MNVVITGGSRGIGAEAVRRFSALGHRVTFLYASSHAEARALARETGAEAVCCDVADAEAVRRTFANLEDTDLLITCAGVSTSGLIQHTSDEDWRRLFAVNVDGVFHAVRGVVPGMIRRGRGAIITVSSIWGQCGASCEVGYSATKGAVVAMTKALAMELAPSGIRVNSVSPGAIMTDMLSGYTEVELDAFRQETPLGLLGTPSDVVDAMVYLANAPFVTGQILGVNGGYVM